MFVKAKKETKRTKVLTKTVTETSIFEYKWLIKQKAGKSISNKNDLFKELKFLKYSRNLLNSVICVEDNNDDFAASDYAASEEIVQICDHLQELVRIRYWFLLRARWVHRYVLHLHALVNVNACSLVRIYNSWTKFAKGREEIPSISFLSHS